MRHGSWVLAAMSDVILSLRALSLGAVLPMIVVLVGIFGMCVHARSGKAHGNEHTYLLVQDITMGGTGAFTTGTGVHALVSCCADSKVQRQVLLWAFWSLRCLYVV